MPGGIFPNPVTSGGRRVEGGFFDDPTDSAALDEDIEANFCSIITAASAIVGGCIDRETSLFVSFSRRSVFCSILLGHSDRTIRANDNIKYY